MSEYKYGSSRRRTSNTDSSRKSGEKPGTKKHSSYSYSSGRNSGSKNRRKRRNDIDVMQLLMYGIGAVILLLCIVLAVKGCGKISGKGKGDSDSSEVSSLETTQGDQVTVDGIVITGMSEEEAKTAVLKQYAWGMKVTYQDKEAAVNNLMEAKVSALIDEIYASEQKESAAYEVKADNMMEAAKAEAALIAGGWNMVAKNGGISGYDKEKGTFTFSQGTNGIVIDQDKLAQNIVEAIQKKDYKAVVTAQTKEVAPEMSADQLKAQYKTIATYTTKTTSSSNRNENIRLASNALNGLIVNPGQEFSFNNATGARTEAKGYKPATAYLNGEVVQEPGGGVCQLSSTLYNAVVFAGLTSTERHAHSYEPSYVTPGEDAAVSYGGPDFKFVNNSDYPVAIKTSFANQELTTSIYGVPILKEGEKVRMSSEKTENIDPPPPTYEEDQTLQPDVEQTVKEGTMGSRWVTDIVKYKDGKEVTREFFHKSSYRGKAAIIKRNTSGVVVTTAAPTVESTAPSVGENQEIPDTTENPGGVGPAGPGQETQPGQVSPNPTASETVPPITPGGGGQSPQGVNPGGQSPGIQGPGVVSGPNS